MGVEVFDSLEKIRSRLDGAKFLETHSNRKKALEYYFSKRGVVQLDVGTNPRAWPALIYPTRDKLALQVKSLETRHKEHSSKKWNWQMTHLKTSSNQLIAHAQKIADPLYWKHLSKVVTDKEYRDAAKTIDLQPTLMADEKYRPMMEAFVHNPEYRKQLTEAVKTSPVYQNHKGLGKHAEDRRQLKMDVSKNIVEKTSVQVKENQEHLFALKELLSWSKENHSQKSDAR